MIKIRISCDTPIEKQIVLKMIGALRIISVRRGTKNNQREKIYIEAEVKK